MYDILCDCENIVNFKPLTYISEDLEFEPLTPIMLLCEIKEDGVPDNGQYRCKLFSKNT